MTHLFIWLSLYSSVSNKESVTGEFVVFSLRTLAVVTFVTPRLTQILLQLLVLEQRAQLGRFVTTLLFLLFCCVSHALSSFGCHGRNFPNRDNGKFKLIHKNNSLCWRRGKRSAVADRWRFNAAKPLFPERRLTGWKIPFYWVILNPALFCIIIPQVKATTREKNIAIPMYTLSFFFKYAFILTTFIRQSASECSKLYVSGPTVWY